MLASTTELIDVAARAAALPGAARDRSGLRRVCDRLDEAVAAADEVTAFLTVRIGGAEPGAVAVARAETALAAQMDALTGAGRLLRGLLPESGGLDGDLRARAAVLLGEGVNVLDSLARIVAAGRVPLGPSPDEIAALAWRSRGPDTAARLSRQSRMVAGARDRWVRAAPPVRGKWSPPQRDAAARHLRLCGAGEGRAAGREALAALRAEAV